jgi:hypothetical protein
LAAWPTGSGLAGSGLAGSWLAGTGRAAAAVRLILAVVARVAGLA